MFKQSIEFEVKNGAYSPESINRDIANLVYVALGFVNCEGRNPEIESQISSLDMSNYYMSDGAKVTKAIKKVVGKIIGKKELEPVFPELCKKISELYSPAFQAKAYFGDKSLIGTGTWENRETCFASNGCNAQNGVFIQKFPRTQVLVVEEIGTRHKARCLVYFQGGRNINLFNFYYNGFRQNKLIFVEAIRRLMGLHKITYKNESVNLPIYMNGDGLLVYTERSFNYPWDRIFPCPHCDTKLPERRMLTAEEGNTYKIGCCDECLDEGGQTCVNCDCRISEDDSRYSDNGDGPYCQSCYDDRYVYCDHCNHEVSADDYLGNGYCNDCGSECHDCGKIKRKENMYSDNDGDWFCESCYPDHYTSCCKCGDETPVEDVKEGPDGNNYCESCHDREFTQCEHCSEWFEDCDINDIDDKNYCDGCKDKLFVECAECGNDVKKSEAVDAGELYCRDCYEGLYEEHSVEQAEIQMAA